MRSAQRQLADIEQPLVGVPPQRSVAQGELRARVVAEADDPALVARRARERLLDAIAQRRRHDGGGAARLGGEDAQLRGFVLAHRSVPVEMVGRDVEQHGDLGREAERVLELERGHLAGDDVLRGDLADERAQRCPDVSRDSDGDIARAQDVRNQLDGRRLAVRAGNGDELIREQAPAELELAEHGHAARARLADDRVLGRDAGALDERSRAIEQRRGVIGGSREVQLDGARTQLVEAAGLAPVDADDDLAARGEGERGGDSRARKPDDEIRARGDRRAGDHPRLWR